MSFKKLLLSLILVLLSVCTGFSQANQPPDIARIIKKGKLVVAMTAADQSPFFFVNAAGELVGLDVEIAKEIADKLGVKAEFDRSSKSFDDVVRKVQDGSADVAISKLSRTYPRAKNVRFSTPYMSFKHGLLLNRMNIARALRDLKITEKEYIRKFSGKIGVIEHSSFETYAKTNFPNAQIIPYAKWDDVITDVNSGTIDAAYRDELEIKKIIRFYPDASLKVKTALIVDKADYIAIAARWNDVNLLAFINIIIESGAFSNNAEQLLNLYGDNLIKK